MLLFALSLGCNPPAPPSFVGVWKTTESSPDAVKLVFREDGVFYRIRDFGDYEWRTAGKYRVEHRYILFESQVEGFIGRDPSDMDTILKAKYEVRGAQLVLFPGSSKEERFVQIE